LIQDGHVKECTVVTFHHDGSLVLSADASGVALLWDIRSGFYLFIFIYNIFYIFFFQIIFIYMVCMIIFFNKLLLFDFNFNKLTFSYNQKYIFDE
jgi:WD40 repeat protein